MPLVNTVQSNLTAGQLTPLLKGQVDFNKYYNGAELIKNIIPLPTGGGTRRPGFMYQAFISPNSRLIKFQSSLEEGYVLVVQNATNALVNVYKDGVSLGNFSTTLFGTDDIDEGYSIAQSKDTLFLTFKGGAKVIRLISGDGVTWTVNEMDLIDGPYEEINTDPDLRVRPLATSGGTTVVASLKSTSANVATFTSADVGKLIRIRHNFTDDGDSANNWGYGTILNINSSITPVGSAVDVQVADGHSFGTTNNTINWRLSKFSAASGFADDIAFFAGRFWIAKDNNIEGSVNNSFDRFSPTIPDGENNHVQTDNSAISLRLLDLQSEFINWLIGNEVLHVGTDTGRYVLRGADSFAAITPTNNKLVRQSTEGCANINPIQFKEIIYVRSDRRALLATQYNFQQDSYDDTNLNTLSDTILNARVKKIVKMTRPFKMVWCLLDDGKLVSLTYDAQQEVIAWAEHEHGSGGEIKDIEVVESGGVSDELYIVVDNNGNGSLQQLGAFSYRGDLEPSEHVLLDGSQKLLDPTGYTGRQDLVGSNPYLIQEFQNIPLTEEATSANYTFPEAFTGTVEVGFPMDVRIRFMPFDIASANSSLQAQFKNIESIVVNLYETLSATFKRVDSKFEEPLDFRDADDDVNAAPPLFSGLQSVDIMGDTDEEIQVEVFQEEQAPFTILNLGYRMQVEPQA